MSAHHLHVEVRLAVKLTIVLNVELKFEMLGYYEQLCVIK